MERKTTVAITPMEFVMYLNKSESGAVTLDGCEGKFLQIVLEALKIKYEILISKDMLYSNPLPDGNFTGMVGMVQRGEVDLAMTCLAVNEIRSKVVNFSMPYYTGGISFITDKSQNSKQNLALLHISDTPTWIGIGIPAKVAPIRTFTSFPKLRSQEIIRVYAIKTYIPFLLDSEEYHLKELGKVIIRNNWITSVRTFEETYHVTSQTSRIQPRILSVLEFENRDDIFISDDELCVLHVAFAYNNNFCCKSKLNAILSKLWGSGLFEKLLRDTSFKSFLKSRNNKYHSTIKSSLSVGDFMGVFTLLGIGLMLSFFIFILEINFP
ncbi:uncharacterized protein CEXT_632401 [Caerostris extrusa]|uniref:Ionotropic glutamate receptor L-glutamate and glycine-binding domain-containing protein n=1 Tax=Caerostris extrusa TaxID=172846 RepID=A0AAV4XF99_CAEEX|nr:uncharacterized protein CEXT_632401 [Caerostris extrusa]